jgi:hypothetical protein
MFLIHWHAAAHAQMQDLVSRHPAMLTDFIYSLRELTTLLNREADTWGESRSNGLRLGYVGVLQVLIWTDEEDEDSDEDRVVKIVRVKLARHHPPG